MNWEGLATGIVFVAAFVGGYAACFKLKVWHSIAYERQQKEYEARDDYAERMDEVMAKVKARGGSDMPELEDSSPLGPVPPTPEELDRLEDTKKWERLKRQSQR